MLSGPIHGIQLSLHSSTTFIAGGSSTRYSQVSTVCILPYSILPSTPHVLNCLRTFVTFSVLPNPPNGIQLSLYISIIFSIDRYSTRYSIVSVNLHHNRYRLVLHTVFNSSYTLVLYSVLLDPTVYLRGVK